MRPPFGSIPSKRTRTRPSVPAVDASGNRTKGATDSVAEFSRALTNSSLFRVLDGLYLTVSPQVRRSFLATRLGVSRPVQVWRGQVRHGMAGRAWQGPARPVGVWRGVAGGACHGVSWFGKARLGWAWRGTFSFAWRLA